MGKTVEELLKVFEKAGVKRRETIANNAGFENAEEYEKHLKSRVIVKQKPVVHVVDIIDASGSMDGKKLQSALTGYNQELERMKTDDSAEYLLSTYVFSAAGGNKVFYNTPVKDVSPLSERASGMTPLYLTIIEVLNSTETFVKEGEKVIVNIFTDGDDNASGYLNKQRATELIQKAKSKNWVVTFIGTEEDTQRMINQLGVEATNTLVHDNTAESIAKSFSTKSAATMDYVSQVNAGVSDELLSTGFYKEKGKL